MSKHDLGVMGKFYGKIGVVVGFTWKGLQVARAYISRVANPKTTAQQLVRTRFAAAGHLASMFLPAISVGLKNLAGSRKSTDVGEFVRLNWAKIQAATPGDYTIDYTGLVIAKGGLCGVDFGSPAFDDPLEVAIDITPNLDGYKANANDKVYIFVYCPDMESVLLPTPVSRSTNSVTIPVPNSWNGQKVYIWGFTLGNATDNKGLCSNSTYIGSGNIS